MLKFNDLIVLVVNPVAAKMALHKFMQSRDVTVREKEMLRSVKVQHTCTVHVLMYCTYASGLDFTGLVVHFATHLRLQNQAVYTYIM